MLKRLLIILAAALAVLMAAIGLWWASSAPPDHLVIAPPYAMGPVPESILEAEDSGDPIGVEIETFAPSIAGYDDVVVMEERGRAYVTAQDGWIWEVNLETGEAERFVDAPLMAAGAHEIPGKESAIAFCASYLHGQSYPENETPGLYRLDLQTKTVSPIARRVPIPPPDAAPPPGNEGVIYALESEEPLAMDAMDDTNSRPIAFANDFAVSSDGQRFYFSEPFAYEGASMGGGTVAEAISLGDNGYLWKVDVAAQTVALVAQDYHFVDGVLLEEENGVEQSVLITETPKFRIMRIFLKGERAGEDEIVWDSLPGMPDGMDRDAEGNIWIGMLKMRSGLITWAHANPWIKPLMLRIPADKLPVSLDTAVLALSPDASTPLWYAEHPGTKITDIAVAIPTNDHIYLANFSQLTPGVHRIPNPLRPGTTRGQFVTAEAEVFPGP